MFTDPSGEFIVTLSTILIAMAVSAVVGATIGVGVAVYNDVNDDGIFNFSIGMDNYIAYTLGGAIAGSGLGVCLALGAGAGTAYILGTSATLFTAGGIGVTFGTALAIGTTVAFTTGMAGYAIRAGISSTESYSFKSMIRDGFYNSLSGALSVYGGYVVGVCGFRIDFVGQAVSRGVRIATPIIQNIYTIGIKVSLSLLKSGYWNGMKKNG